MLLIPGYDEPGAGGKCAFQDPIVRLAVLDHARRFGRPVYHGGAPAYLSHRPLDPISLPTEFLAEDAPDFAQHELADVQIHYARPHEQVGPIRHAAEPVVRGHQHVGAEDDFGYSFAPSFSQRQ